MPFKSQQQRKLGYAAAATPGGVGNMPQAVGKEFVAADMPGKLPQTVAKPKALKVPMPPMAPMAPKQTTQRVAAPPGQSNRALAAEVTRRVAARSK